MLISLLILLLLANAVTLRHDKSILFSKFIGNAVTLRHDKSRLFSKFIILGLIATSFIALYIDIGVYGGLFNLTTFSQTFNIFIFIISAVILTLNVFSTKKVCINQTDINVLYAAQFATLLIGVSLRTILLLVLPNNTNAFFILVLIAIITLCNITIKSLSIQGTIPSRVNYFFSFSASFILGLINHFSINSEIGSIISYYNPNASLYLASLSHSIKFKLDNLDNWNLTFEEYFEKAHKFRASGDTVNEDLFTVLARRERLNIRNNLPSVLLDLNQRHTVAMQCQLRYPDSEYSRFANMTISEQEIVNISHTLANNVR